MFSFIFLFLIMPLPTYAQDSLTKFTDLSVDNREAFLQNYHAENSNLFTEKDNKLVVNLKNKKTVEFTNNTDDGDAYVKYTYLIFIPEINSHLVSAQWYEGGEYILIHNDTAAKQSFWNIPMISPKNNRLAVANYDLEAAYTPNGIQIFEIVSGQYIKSFEQMFEDWGPVNPRWINNDEFAANKLASWDGVEHAPWITPGEIKRIEELNKETVYLKRIKGKWAIS